MATQEVAQSVPVTILADLCEQAAGPDDALDAAIWLSVKADERARKAYDAGLKLSRSEGAFRLSYMSDGFRPTASIDAAITLVPEGYVFSVGSWGNPDTDGPWAWCATKQQSAENDIDYGKAATAPLALCAAALKARATEEAG